MPKGQGYGQPRTSTETPVNRRSSVSGGGSNRGAPNQGGQNQDHSITSAPKAAGQRKPGAQSPDSLKGKR